MAQLSGPEIEHEAISDPESSLLEWSPPGLLDASELEGAAPAAGVPRTVVVFSPKGGVGTTFLAVNLAIALSERGRRRVCVLDLDLEFGDVAIVAGLSPHRGIADAVGQPLDDEETIDADTDRARHRGRLRAVADRPGRRGRRCPPTSSPACC